MPSSVASFPGLLRGARATYGRAIRSTLAQAGYDDIPGNGLFVIAAAAQGDLPLARLVHEMGTSKQAAGQLIDTLVLRGYVERQPDPDDRRRLRVTASERGRAAAGLIASAVARIDAGLAQRVPAQAIAHARQTLAALAQMRDEATRPSSGDDAR